MDQYSSGFGFPQNVIFDDIRAKRLLTQKWFFVGTRGDIPTPREFFNFQLFDNQYFLLHGNGWRNQMYGQLLFASRR